MKQFRKHKYGYQNRKRYAWKLNKKRYNEISIPRMSYCASHNFVFDPEIETQKLYNAQPCFYTDTRYDGHLKYGSSDIIHWKRFKDLPLKKLVNKAKSVRNVPQHKHLRIDSSYYIPGVPHLDVKVKPSKLKFDPKYEINDPKYSTQFTNDQWCMEFTRQLRAAGFIVSVSQETDYTDNRDIEVGLAFGHNKKIGFSPIGCTLFGYSNGRGSILFDECGYFDKWSRCEEIDQHLVIPEIISILTQPYLYT
jgi:hypothetical protein